MSRTNRPRPGLPLSKCPRHRLHQRTTVNVSKNGKHTVVRHSQSRVQVHKVISREQGNRAFRAGRIHPVAPSAKKRLPHRLERALQQVIPLRANARQLHFALALKRLGREGGVQKHVAQHIHCRRRICSEHLDVDPKRVVSPVALDASANFLDRARNFLRRAPFCALEQHPSRKLRDAVFLRGLVQHATAKNRAHIHKRKAMVLFQQQSQAVRQFHFLNPRVGCPRDLRKLFRGRPRWQKAIKSAPRRVQILLRRPQHGFRSRPPGRFKKSLGKVQVPRRNPTSPKVLRLALHRLSRSQRG